jgi:hypothetical protein
LGAFSKILGTSLAATGVVIAGKAIVDSFQKVSESVDKAKDSLASAREEIGKMGAIAGLAEGAAQANLLYRAASEAEKAIKEIEKSRLQNFIAEIRGAKDELSAMAAEARKAAEAASLEGIQRQAAEISIDEGRTEADKAAAKAAEKFTPLINEARKLGNQPLVESLIIEQQKAAQKAVNDLRQKAFDEFDRKQAQQKLKLIDADIAGAEAAAKIARQSDRDAAKQAEESLNRLYEERAKKEEEIRKKQEKATKESVLLQEKVLDAQDRVNEARKRVIEADAKVADLTLKASGTGRGAGQRATSLEIGAQRAAERAFQNEQRRLTRQAYEDFKLASEVVGQPADRYSFNREQQRRLEEKQRQAAREPFNQQEEAQKNLKSSEAYLKAINKLLEDNLNELKTYAHVV